MARNIVLSLGVAMLVFALALAAVGQTQKTVDVIYLKSGSVVKGTILEAVPNKSVRIQTLEGKVKSYKMNTVKKLAKETITIQEQTKPAEVKSENQVQAPEKSAVMAPTPEPANQDVLRKPIAFQSDKSPALAAALSAVLPGMGQLYNDEYFPKGMIQTALVGTGVVLALTLGTESVYSSNPYTDTGYYGTYTYYRSSTSDETTAWLYVGIGVAGAAWLWSVIDAPVSASSINDESQGARYGHVLEMTGPGYVVGVDPGATQQGVGARLVVHF